MRRARAIGPASSLSVQRFLQDLLAGGEVGHHLLELAILLAQLPEFAHLDVPRSPNRFLLR